MRSLFPCVQKGKKGILFFSISASSSSTPTFDINANMQFKSQLMLASAAAAAVSNLEVREVNVVHVLEKLHIHPNAVVNYTPNKRDEDVLFARADREDCQDSAIDILNSAPTADPELEDWAQSVLDEGSSTDPCSLFVPSSLSSDMMEYMTSYIDWIADVEDDVADFNEECSQYVEAQFVRACPTPGTVFFTENNKTETIPLNSLIASATADSGNGGNDNAAASRDRSLTAAIAAAVGVVGVVMAL
ncbi:hypothetical protein EDB81DRAFT_797600 [Dactylonectria macrodidyma]|uniref:Infection structure specific protein n=1 Tax=Dactylonectria macrodidyma TaxID=307937 RepID=A0A9P9EQI2_9HYPO|nr:hypothetical protein EDB81DRAFT_797600 [Dactylonectria macrodidyma]